MPLVIIMNITMNNKISEYNANIGHEFDKQSAELKAKNLRYTKAYIGFLASGAVFADLGGLADCIRVACPNGAGVGGCGA